MITLAYLLSMERQSDCFSQIVVNDSSLIKLRQTVEDLKNKYHSPAIVIAIVHGNEIIHTEATGYTDLGNTTPVTIDSKFPIMSVTKTFTATMMMQLVEKSIVKLDDDIKKYVPEYKVKSNFKSSKKTTLFQLATHSSGLPRNSQSDINFVLSFDRWIISKGNDSISWFSTKKELLNSLQYVDLIDPPFDYLHHNDRHYSNLGYSILGIATERAAKTDYATYVLNNILNPLKMTNSGFLEDSIVNKDIVKGYWFDVETGTSIAVPAFRPYSALYAGGMFSTARDLSKFISFQFDNNSASAPVLSEESKRMMRYLKIGWKPAFPFVLHEGSIPGYKCVVVLNPKTKFGWVILTNTTEFDFNSLNNHIAEILNTIPTKKPATALNQYTGTYKLKGNYGSFKIYLKNDSLYSTYLQSSLSNKPLVPDRQHRFKLQASKGYDIVFEFVPDDKEEIRVIKLGQLVWYKEE